MIVRKENGTFYIKLLVVLAFMFGFRYIPPISVLTVQGMEIIGILIGLILAWVWDSKCTAWSSLLALFALSTTSYGDMTKVVATSFGSTTLVMMIVTMLIVGSLVDAEIDNYLIKKIMGLKWAQGKPWVLTFLLIFGPYILGFFITNIVVALFLLPIYGRIFKAVGYQKGDRYVMHVYIGAMFSLICASFTFPFIKSPLIYGSLVEGYMGAIWTNVEYMLTITPFILLMCAGYVFFMRLLRCDASKMRAFDIVLFGGEEEINKHQKGVLYAMYAYIIGCLIISFGGLGTNAISDFLNLIGVYGWGIIIAVAMMIIKVDDKRLMDIKNAAHKGLNWDVVFLVAVATTVASALTTGDTGVSELMTLLLVPILGGFSTYTFMIILAIILVILVNITNGVAVRMVALTICGALVAAGMNLNGPAVGALVLLISNMAILLPSSSFFGAFLHTAELVTTEAIYKNVCVSMLYFLVCLVVIYVPLCMIVY